MKFRNSAMLLFCLLAVARSDGQTRVTGSKCQMLDSFINSKEVFTWIREIETNKDSTLVFLDPNNLLSPCKLTTWRNYKVELVNSGQMIDSLKRYEFHYIVKKRPRYYQIRQDRVGKEQILTLHRGYDNLISQATISRGKKRYYLGKIKSSVL
jgi:hypothetical protein